MVVFWLPILEKVLHYKYQKIEKRRVLSCVSFRAMFWFSFGENVRFYKNKCQDMAVPQTISMMYNPHWTITSIQYEGPKKITSLEVSLLHQKGKSISGRAQVYTSTTAPGIMFFGVDGYSLFLWKVVDHYLVHDGIVDAVLNTVSETNKKHKKETRKVKEGGFIPFEVVVKDINKAM
jgi:hypothetical protein